MKNWPDGRARKFGSAQQLSGITRARIIWSRSELMYRKIGDREKLWFVANGDVFYLKFFITIAIINTCIILKIIGDCILWRSLCISSFVIFWYN